MKTIWEKKYTMPEWGKLYKEYEKMCFSGKYAYKIDLSRLGITTPNDIAQVEIVFRENKMYTVYVLHKDKSMGYEGRTGQWYSHNDGGFGSFLWDKYGEKGEEKMATIKWNMNGGVDSAVAAISSNTGELTYTNSAEITSASNIATAYSSVSYSLSHSDITEIQKEIEKLKCKVDTKEDKKRPVEAVKEDKMNKLFDFGPCNDANIRVSAYGIAVKNNENKWVSYNISSGEIIDVELLNIAAASKFLYKMPVPLKKVAVGDTVLHNGVPVFVKAINQQGSLVVVDPKAGEIKTILLTKNMFGFDFATKVVNIFSMFAEKPTEDNPFGNMLPMMLMGDGKMEMKDLAIMSMMTKGEGMKDMFSNPMMMLMLSDKKDLDPMTLMMMMNMNK